MKDIGVVLKALVSQLRADSQMLQKGFVVKQGAYVNQDPDIEPWCCVYKSARAYTSGTLGHHEQQWDNAIGLRVLTQAAHYGDGDKCDELLEQRIKLILDAVQADHTLGGEVDQLLGMNVSYNYVYGDSSSILFQEAIIDLNYEVYDG